MKFYFINYRKPPGYIDNNELLDFISRIPSRKEIYEHSLLKLESNSNINSANNNNYNNIINKTVSETKEYKKKK